MKERINVAELIKDCPKGMELDCVMYEDVKFIGVEEYDKPICIKAGDIYRYLTKFGTWTFDENAKCVIFPKGKTTWEGFVPPCKFKAGDVLVSECGNIVLLSHIDSGNIVHYHCIIPNCGSFRIEENTSIGVGKYYQCDLANEQQRQRMYDRIKCSGYKYNQHINKLEKLVEPKFKVGDMIKLKNTPTNNILTVTKTNDDGSLNVNMYSWVIKYELQDEYELVLNNQPKFKVGDKIKKKGEARLISIKDVRDDCYIITFPDYFGHCYITDKLSFSNQGDYELTPNKFDITTLKAFDKVLVRDSDKDMWCASIFSHTWKDKYFCTGAWYNQCIPYEANKELLGTTNNPKGHGSN